MRRHDGLLRASPGILFEKLIVRLTFTRRWWWNIRHCHVDSLWLLLWLLLWCLESLLLLLLLLL